MSHTRGPSEAKEMEWRAESDHHTLADAADIQSDKSRMAGAATHHKKSMKKHAAVSRFFSKGR